MRMKGVNFKLSASNAAGPAFASFNRGVNSVKSNVASTVPVMRSWNAGLNGNRRAVQQFGFQMSDFAIQVSGGQSAVLAFIQQGGQMLQFFGPAGAVLAALVAVFGSLYLGVTRAGVALNELYPYLGVLEDEFRGVVDAIKSVLSVAADLGMVLVENLDVIIISVAVAIGWFGTRWVIATVAASRASRVLGVTVYYVARAYRVAGAAAAAKVAITYTLIGAMNLLKTAMVKLGLPALIIFVGYLIERFMTLARGAGGVGNALVLLGDLAKQVFLSIGDLVAGLWHSFAAMTKRVSAYFTDMIARMLGDFMDFTWSVADGMNALFNTDRFSGAKMGDMIGGMKIAALDMSRAAEASSGRSAAAYERASSRIADSWRALKEAMRLGEGDALPKFDFGKKDDEKTSSGPADKAKEEADRIKKIFEKMQESISASMLSAFKGLLDGSKSFGDAARDVLSGILDNVIDILMTPIFDAVAGNIAGGIIGGLGGGFGLGNLLSFDGGGDTWSGPRAGGLDGKGGRLAMLHSDETVLDNKKGQTSGKSGDTYNMTWNIQTPDVNSFAKSKQQIQAELQRAVQSGSRGN